MGVNISTLNVKLTATTAAFTSAIASAAKPLVSFGSSITSVGGKVLGWGSALTSLAAGGSLLALTHQSMEAIDANAKLADRLGLSTEGLTGLQHAGNLAGVSSDQLTGALEKMMKSLGGAADDGELASNVFSKLGLNAADLANLPADAAFTQIAQKLAEIQNPAERATAAMQIFGKSGQSLLPLLMSGSEGIKAAQLEAQKLGLTFSRIDAAKVEAANDSMTRLGAVVTGVGNQLAIGLAPYIDAAATKLTAFATEGGGIGPKVGGAIEWVARGIATAADYLELGVAGFKLLQAGGTLAVLGLIGTIDLLGRATVGLLNLLPGVNVQWTGYFKQMADGLVQDVDRLTGDAGDAFQKFQNGDASKAVGRIFDDIRQHSQASAEGVAKSAQQMNGAFKGLEDSTANLKKVSDTLADLQKEVDQFGMSAAEKKVSDLTALGASPDQIASAQASLEKLQGLQDAKKASDDMDAKAKQVFDDTRTPLEKYDEQIGNLSDLLQAGKLDWDTYGRAVRKAREDLESTAKVNEAPTLEAPQLIKAGTAEAAKFAYDISRGQGQITNRDDLPKKQLAEQQETNRVLSQIAKNTGDSSSDGPEVVGL